VGHVPADDCAREGIWLGFSPGPMPSLLIGAGLVTAVMVLWARRRNSLVLSNEAEVAHVQPNLGEPVARS
jgi:hypothetical protein